MEKEKLIKALNSMRDKGKIRDYYLTRTDVNRYTLEVQHEINGVYLGVLMSFDYDYFNADMELKLLKKYMTDNYINYLE